LKTANLMLDEPALMTAICRGMALSLPFRGLRVNY